MKKCFICMLVLGLVLSLAGCINSNQNVQDPSSISSEANNISECLTEEDGKQYLILPISNDKIKIRDEQVQYLDEIDLDLLKAAEEKISQKISQYSNNSGFYLQVDEGQLCLYVEVIVKIEPPASSDNIGGCGMDHKHMFFCEQITK